MLFFAGHGMQLNGLQVIVINEFDKVKKFYKLYNAENKIRYFSKKFTNCYFVGIFACCREICDLLNKHTGCISAQEYEKMIKNEETKQKE